MIFDHPYNAEYVQLAAAPSVRLAGGRSSSSGRSPNLPGDWPRLASVTLAAGSASADEEQHVSREQGAPPRLARQRPYHRAAVRYP